MHEKPEGPRWARRDSLGEQDEMVQKHIYSFNKKGSAINTTVANATTKAPISK